MFRRTDPVDHQSPRLPTGALRSLRTAARSALPAVLALAVLTAPAALDAQEGTITYTRSFRLDIELPPELAELKANMPSALTSTMVLHFSPSGSLMTETGKGTVEGGAGNKTIVVSGGSAVSSEMPIDIPVAAMSQMMAGAKMMVSFGGAPGVSAGDASTLLNAYENYEDGTLIETREFLGRTFRVSEERKSLDWRMTTDQAMHLGYPVMKATAEHDSTTVEAWFSPQIPIQGGPASYGGLPGMILLLSLDDGRTQYQATEVALEALEAGRISAPDEGREVTREEFDGIVAEKMEEIMKTRSIRRIGSR